MTPIPWHETGTGCGVSIESKSQSDWTIFVITLQRQMKGWLDAPRKYGHFCVPDIFLRVYLDLLSNQKLSAFSPFFCFRKYLDYYFSVWILSKLHWYISMTVIDGILFNFHSSHARFNETWKHIANKLSNNNVLNLSFSEDVFPNKDSCWDLDFPMFWF